MSADAVEAFESEPVAQLQAISPNYISRIVPQMKKLITLMLALYIGSTMSCTAAQTSAAPQASDSIAKQMAPDADPSFEVATIKPTNPDHPTNALPLGHHITFPATSVRFLLAFVYDIHDKQNPFHSTSRRWTRHMSGWSRGVRFQMA
jgi:hypothetical protein